MNKSTRFRSVPAIAFGLLISVSLMSSEICRSTITSRAERSDPVFSDLAESALVPHANLSKRARTPISTNNTFEDLKNNHASEGVQQTSGTIEEIQIGDPPSGKTRAISEVLTLDAETAASIDQSVSGESKAAKVDSKLLALETLKLAKDYAQARVNRVEPPTPSKVKSFLALYGLPFRYPNGSFVPYCASGVGFAAARAHYRMAWPKDHPNDPQHADPGDDFNALRDALPDVTRDYCKTHPSTVVMVNAAKGRKYPNGQSFWVSTKIRPKQGWLVFFNWSQGKKPQHVGIVDGINSSGKILSTVEFNTSKDNPSNGGNVVAKTRNIRYVIGYIRTYP